MRALRSIRSRLSSGRRLPSRQARSIPAPQRSECTFSHTQNLLFRILPFPDDTPPFPLSCPEARFPNIRRRRETDSRYTTSENGTTKLRKRRTSGKRVRDSRIPPATTASLAERRPVRIRPSHPSFTGQGHNAVPAPEYANPLHGRKPPALLHGSCNRLGQIMFFLTV